MGPSWGSGQRSGETSPDSACGPLNFDCNNKLPPGEKFEGVGFQIKAQGAFAWRYLGLGAQLQIQYIPKHTIAGVSLFMPIGLIK